MENLSLIAAIGKNNELGLDNHLIWKIKEDLKFYRSYTLNQNIIMGRKTFESMPMAALQKRNVYVLSSKPIDSYCDVNCYNNIEGMLHLIENTGRNFIVVGGAQIYSAFLPYVDTMYLTEIYEDANADTFFPKIDLYDWSIETIFEHDDVGVCQDDNYIPYVRNRYTRKKVK